MTARTIRYLVLLVISITAGYAAYSLMPAPLPELSRDGFMDEVRAGHVRKIEIEDQEVIIGDSTTRGEFRTEFNRERDAQLPAELRALGIEVRFSKSPPGI